MDREGHQKRMVANLCEHRKKLLGKRVGVENTLIAESVKVQRSNDINLLRIKKDFQKIIQGYHSIVREIESVEKRMFENNIDIPVERKASSRRRVDVIDKLYRKYDYNFFIELLRSPRINKKIDSALQLNTPIDRLLEEIAGVQHLLSFAYRATSNTDAKRDGRSSTKDQRWTKFEKRSRLEDIASSNMKQQQRRRRPN